MMVDLGVRTFRILSVFEDAILGEVKGNEMRVGWCRGSVGIVVFLLFLKA